MALTAATMHGAPQAVQMLTGEIPFDQNWQTTCCQLGGYETCCGDWALALCFPPLAGGLARSKVDGTNCFFATIVNTPAYNYNVVRRRYGIIGDDGNDAVYATFMMPCAVRQALTEATKRGRLQDRGVYKWSEASQETQQWMRGLCDCNPATFCYAVILPQCLSAQARTNFDGSGCCFNTACSTPCGVYNTIRQGYGIRGNCFMDFFTVSSLYPCAIQQAYEEALYKYLQKLGEQLKKSCPCCC